ncbi:MAG: DMT family transporter [Dehalococcoidales bacterium]|jgi:transporter family protein
MDTGLVLALIASVSFAVGIVMVRKTAGDAGESFSVTALSISIGIPYFAIAISVSGGWGILANVSGKVLGLLIATGIIHYIIGRLLAYEAFRLIGANRATPFNQTSPIYTILLSWIFLDERVTGYIAIGALCMLAGVFLITREKKSISGEIMEKVPRDTVRGILAALGAALCWGITPVLIKPAVEELGSSSAATFISYAAAAVVMALLFLKRSRRQRFAQLSFKRNILPMSIAGVFTATGQLLYFTSLGHSPANVIAPLLSIQILFIFIFSWLINRRTELFTAKVALGMAATVAGTFLLFR